MKKRKRIIGVKETDQLMDKLDFDPILESRVRQVRWLYNNSGKCMKVYEERLVRYMIHRLRERIKELESQNQ